MAKRNEGHDKQDKEDRKRKKKDKGDKKKKDTGKKSATQDIKDTTQQGECPVITMNPTAAQMAVPPDEAANDLSVYSTGPGEAVMYHYDRQGQFAEEFASQQAEQSAVPAGVSVAGPGGG